MDAADNRRVIRYAGEAADKTIINQIMLRFRPIAPKPAAGAPDSGIACSKDKDALISRRRPKRKYVRVRRNNRFRKNNRVSPSSDQAIGRGIESGGVVAETVVTLQLLPDSGDQVRKSPERDRSWCNQEFTHPGGEFKMKQPAVFGGVDREAAAPVSKIKLESLVTVECVTDTYGCMDSGYSRGLGLTDAEIEKNLEQESLPAFISDGADNVRWMNSAYQRMMKEMRKENGKAESVEIIVRLATKQKLLPFLFCSAFTCWVRLQHRFGDNGKSTSKMVPCDVWRMNCGGFAWRLDIEAALSLSLGH